MTEQAVLSLALIALGSFVLSYVGAAVGLVLGQLRVALLCYVIGDPAVGAATSLSISTVATIVGTITHLRGGRVDGGLLLAIGLPSALAAGCTAYYARSFPTGALKTVIAVTLLVTGISLLRQAGSSQRSLAPTPPLLRSPRLEVAVQVLIGIVLGSISGLVGLLLGSLRLPAMVRLTRVPPATAVGTNMAIGAITGVSAGLSAMMGGKVSLTAFAVVCPLTLVGAHLGAHKAGTLDQ
ncbi:MAG TPA: sulfite exporter TauE/SafE family protein, partial [Polyangiales bacterium]